jgi:alcohol dehydrogenase class IV
MSSVSKIDKRIMDVVEYDISNYSMDVVIEKLYELEVMLCNEINAYEQSKVRKELGRIRQYLSVKNNQKKELIKTMVEFREDLNKKFNLDDTKGEE